MRTFSHLIGILRGTGGHSPRWLDGPLRAAEIGVRQIYWRTPWLAARFHDSQRTARSSSVNAIHRSAMRERLFDLGVRPDALVMVHSSLDGLALVDDGDSDGTASTGPQLAQLLLQDISDLIGTAGTLTVPTHPFYANDPGFMHDKRDLVCTYNPRRTPSKVGMLGEMFRRMPGVMRSEHPLSSLAARGPHAGELLRDNLNIELPLPHGVHSGYYRFCRLGGTVVSINTPLIKALSIAHTAEEVRDSEWPVAGFFLNRRFVVSLVRSEQEWIVRERDPVWARNISLGQLRRDLLREGILKESRIGSVRVDSADAAAVFAYMMLRNARSAYPYYGVPKIR